MDYKTEIGNRLKAARDATGASLDKVAEQLNGLLSASRIGNYEQGERMPGPYEINILAKHYGASASYLMCLEDAPPVNSRTPPIRLVLTTLENEITVAVRSAIEGAHRALTSGERPASFLISPDNIRKARNRGGRSRTVKTRRRKKEQQARKGSASSSA